MHSLSFFSFSFYGRRLDEGLGLVWDSGKINSIILKQINILTNFVIGLY